MDLVSLSIEALHKEFLAEIKPRIDQQARDAFWFCGRDRERFEDLTQEATALAWKSYLKLKLEGRTPEDFSSAIATFACKGARGGRKVAGSERKTSVTRQGFLGFVRQERDSLRELADEKATPAECAAYLVDTQEWLSQLDERKRRMARDMVNGETTTDLSVKYGVSEARISQIRRELIDNIRHFHGEMSLG